MFKILNPKSGHMLSRNFDDFKEIMVQSNKAVLGDYMRFFIKSSDEGSKIMKLIGRSLWIFPNTSIS